MKLKDLEAVGKKLQEINFRGNTQTLTDVIRRLTGAVQQITIRNYMHILSKEKYIVFDNGIWEAFVEEQPKEKPIETVEDLNKQIEAYEQAKVIKEKIGTEPKKQKIDYKERQAKQQREVQHLLTDKNYQNYNDKISTLLNQMDRNGVTILWEDTKTYYIVCKDCYELETGKKWTSNHDNKKLRAHVGLLRQAVNTKYCHMCGAKLGKEKKNEKTH